MYHSIDEVENIMKKYLNNIGQTLDFLDMDKQKKVIAKLTKIQSSLNTELAMREMQIKENHVEHIDFSHCPLPSN